MSACWDYAAALRRLDGDAALLQELVAIFFDGYAPLAQRLIVSVREASWEQMREVAHSLKGSLSYLGASRASLLSQELEHIAREQIADRASALSSQLLAEIECVRQAAASVFGEPAHGG